VRDDRSNLVLWEDKSNFRRLAAKTANATQGNPWSLQTPTHKGAVTNAHQVCRLSVHRLNDSSPPPTLRLGKPSTCSHAVTPPRIMFSGEQARPMTREYASWSSHNPDIQVVLFHWSTTLHRTAVRHLHDHSPKLDPANQLGLANTRFGQFGCNLMSMGGFLPIAARMVCTIDLLWA